MPVMLYGTLYYFPPVRCFAWVLWQALGLALMAGVSYAETVDRLYEARVPVVDQSEKERRLALAAALDHVLVRASGQSLAALQANTILLSQRSKAEDYLQEYRYRSMTEEGAAASPALELTAQFAPEAIRPLLARAGLPLWPRNRPTVLAWWQVEEQSQRRLLGDSLRREAEQRGLPMVLPMNDLQDKLLQDGLWQFDPEAIARMGERYGVSTLLVGRATGSLSTGWQGQWLFYFQGEKINIPAATEVGIPAPWLKGETLEDLEKAGIDGVVARLVQHYGIDLAGSSRRAALVVSGIRTFEDYSQLFRHLQSLEAVRTVSLLKAENQVLTYELVFDGQLAVLQELLGLSAILREESYATMPIPVMESDTLPTLRYRFSGQR